MDPHEVTIRNHIVPGDLGFIIHRHGILYRKEYNYGLAFEMYVADGLHEFYINYDPALDRVWIAEHKQSIVGFLLLMHRGNMTGQLRYFYLEPAYRGMGFGRLLMDLFMHFLKAAGYRSAYLWTTHELKSAASLYKRAGFILAEQKETTSFGKLLIEQRYEVTLPQEPNPA
jgi:ribosomal protein S18 acetylase RimI-like enzyme